MLERRRRVAAIKVRRAAKQVAKEQSLDAVPGTSSTTAAAITAPLLHPTSESRPALSARSMRHTTT